MVLVNTEAPARGSRGKTCENSTEIFGVASPPPPACGIEGSLCRMGCCQRVAVHERVDAEAESTHQVARNTAKVTNECTLIRLYACAMATRCRQQHPTQRSPPPPFVPAPLPAGGHTSSSSRRPARLEWGSLRSCTSLAPRLWSGPRTSPRVSSRNSVPSPLLPCHRLRWVPHSNPLFLRPEYRLTDPPISQGLSASESTSPSLALSRQPMTSARPWLEPGDTRHTTLSPSPSPSLLFSKCTQNGRRKYPWKLHFPSLLSHHRGLLFSPTVQPNEAALNIVREVIPESSVVSP